MKQKKKSIFRRKYSLNKKKRKSKKKRSRNFQQKEGNKLGAFLLIVFNNKIGSHKISFLIHNNIIGVYILH